METTVDTTEYDSAKPSAIIIFTSLDEGRTCLVKVIILEPERSGKVGSSRFSAIASEISTRTFDRLITETIGETSSGTMNLEELEAVIKKGQNKTFNPNTVLPVRNPADFGRVYQDNLPKD